MCDGRVNPSRIVAESRSYGKAENRSLFFSFSGGPFCKKIKNAEGGFDYDWSRISLNFTAEGGMDDGD